MKNITTLSIVLYCILTACTSRAKDAETQLTETKISFAANEHWRWVLVSPAHTPSCELWLTFLDNGSLIFGYKGQSFPGTYAFDTELPQYVLLNIPDKPSWNNDCAITPQYLSLYDHNADFAYTMTDEFLYFQKAEKVLTFKKITT